MPKLVSTNPANNYEVIGEVEISSTEEIKDALQQAHKAQSSWGHLSIDERIEKIQPLLDECEKRQDEIIELTVKEIGKPVQQARDDMSFDLDYFRWFLGTVKKALEPQITYEDEKTKHTLYREPRGVAAVITPWNFPFGMWLWGVIPNLLVGNTVVFKHSEECPLVGRLIEGIVSTIGLPKGVFNQVYGGKEIGEELLNQEIDLIWFTGSSAAGQKIYQKAAAKGIPALLEMGGSNPGIVFEDVDIDKIIPQIYSGRFSNCGQVCDALKRLFIHESIFDEVVQKLSDYVSNRAVGEPSNDNTETGSLAAQRQLELLEEQVADAIAKGAEVVVGGKKPEELRGAFYLPTILKNIKPEMKVYNEEVFGPVLPVIPFTDEEEAVKLANDTKYGLGSSVWSADGERALRVAGEIKAGSVEINGASRWIPENPFGGYKSSGIGREHGEVGFHELTQIKIISETK